MRELAQPTLPRAEESGDSGHPSKRQGEKPSESDTRAEELEDTPGVFGGFPLHLGSDKGSFNEYA